MNDSDRNRPLQKKTRIILLLNIDVITTVAALLGCYLVLRSFHKFHNLRTASNIILVSLSTADGLLAIPSVLDIIYLSLKYDANHCFRIPVLQRVIGTFTFFLVSVIILHLALMSVDRFIAIKFALRYHTIVTNRRAKIVSIALWLWALVVTITSRREFHKLMSPYQEYSKICEEGLKRLNTGNQPSEEHPNRPNTGYQPSKEHVVFPAVSVFLVPLLIIMCSYVYIFVLSYQHRKRVREQSDLTAMPTIKHQLKGAHTLAIVVAVCLLSIIPILVVTSLRVFYKKSLGGHHHQKLLQHIVYNVAMFLNAICNPLIYGWKNEEFRNAFRNLLRRN